MQQIYMFTVTLLLTIMGLANTASAAENPAGGRGQGGSPKILVAYFSCTGTTETLAKQAADALGADLRQIQPQEPYTNADLNYHDKSSRCSVEMNDPTARPAIAENVANMADYDIVFLGYPIWWGQAPRIVSTFLENQDFSGKTIVPFCTSGGSDLGSSDRDLHALAGGARWLPGKRLLGSASRDEVIKWINELGIDVTAN